MNRLQAISELAGLDKSEQYPRGGPASASAFRDYRDSGSDPLVAGLRTFRIGDSLDIFALTGGAQNGEL